MFIDPYEMTKMVNLWDGHRNGISPCAHRGDVKIEYGSGGGRNSGACDVRLR